MPVWVEVSWDVNRVIMVLAGNFLLAGLIAMAMRIEVTRHVARMVVVLPRHFLLSRLVPMTVRVEVPRHVGRMVVVLAWLFLGHVAFPSRGRVVPGGLTGLVASRKPPCDL